MGKLKNSNCVKLQYEYKHEENKKSDMQKHEHDKEEMDL